MDALIKNLHAAPNASFECADCGKEYWSDEPPLRCTKCMGFTVRPTSLVPRKSAIEQASELFNGPSEPTTQSEDDMHFTVPVEKMNAGGEVIAEYPSQKDAAAAAGVHVTCINGAVNKRGRAAGFYWRRKGDAWTPPAPAGEQTTEVVSPSPGRLRVVNVKRAAKAKRGGQQLAKVEDPAVAPLPATVGGPINRAIAALTGLAAGCELCNVKITSADLTIEIGTVRIGVKG
jgi:hypothetical protein